MLKELELGVRRSGLCCSRCELGDETSLESSRNLECDVMGEEAGRAVAEAVSSESLCKVAERFAPVLFVDGGRVGDAMLLECSGAGISRSLLSIVAVSSRCCPQQGSVVVVSNNHCS